MHAVRRDRGVEADGEGDEVTADWLRPVHAATTAPATTVRVHQDLLWRARL